MIQGISCLKEDWGLGQTGMAVSHKKPRPSRIPFIPCIQPPTPPPRLQLPRPCPGLSGSHIDHSLCPSACYHVPPPTQGPESLIYSPHKGCFLSPPWHAGAGCGCVSLPLISTSRTFPLPPSALPWSLLLIRPLFPPPPLLASPSKLRSLFPPGASSPSLHVNPHQFQYPYGASLLPPGFSVP